MPLMRVRLGDVVVEVETAEDAVRVQQAYLKATKRVTTPAASVPARPKLFPVPQKTPAQIIFKNGHYRGFMAMYESGDTGLSSEELVNLLGVRGPKSLPPTVAAWGKRAAGIGLDISELLDVDRGYVQGKPHTIYRLSARGREVLRPETEQARIANDPSL